MTSVTQTPLQFDSQDLRFTPQSWQGINSFLSLRWNADNITSDTLLSSFRKRITLPRIHCCRPLGRGIIFANFMHLAIRCLSNMLRSHCSGGMSVSSNLLATARLGMAPFLRWVWQVWQIHCLSLIRHFAVFISADVVTNINILSSQACLNHTWIFFFFFFLHNLTMCSVEFDLEMKLYDTVQQKVGPAYICDLKTDIASLIKGFSASLSFSCDWLCICLHFLIFIAHLILCILLNARLLLRLSRICCLISFLCFTLRAWSCVQCCAK